MQLSKAAFISASKAVGNVYVYYGVSENKRRAAVSAAVNTESLVTVLH